MKIADLKTDGTVYVAQPNFPISANYPSTSAERDVILLDLASKDAPLTRWNDRERKPIKAKIVSTGKDHQTDDIIHLAPRRILCTRVDRNRQLAAEAANKVRWAREREERSAINEPLAARLNEKQLRAGLTDRFDTQRPMLNYFVDRRGQLDVIYARPDVDAFEAVLDKLIASATYEKAIQVASDLVENGENSEYTRGAVEVIADLFDREMPGSGVAADLGVTLS